ncbi:MAG: hypothetical protein WKG07_09050 [Hymenobacter sp.]
MRTTAGAISAASGGGSFARIEAGGEGSPQVVGWLVGGKAGMTRARASAAASWAARRGQLAGSGSWG